VTAMENVLTAIRRGDMIQKNKQKGVSFMQNMVRFVDKYGRSLAPWAFVG
jgi:hypothetical protein